MILIRRGQSNTVCLTLQERTTLTGPYFLLEVKCDQTNEYSYCILTDESIFTERYNKFTIVETSSPDPLEGELTLPLKGYYTYRVFEQLSSTNLDPTLADNTDPLELGKITVTTTETSNPVYSYSNTIKVYNP